MNVTHGMDVAEVEDLGRFLQQRADRLRQVIQEINRAVYAANWEGGVAHQFAQQHWPAHRARLQAAADQLHRLGQSALHNVSEQLDVSGQGGGQSRSGVFPAAGLAAALAGGFGTWAREFGPLRSDEQAGGMPGVWGLQRQVRGSTQFGEDGRADFFVTGRVGAEGHGGTSVDVSPSGLSAKAAIGGSVGTAVAVGGSIASGPVTASGDASAFEGARGDASVSGKLGPDGATVGAHGGAFAGAEAEVGGKVEMGGATVGGGASVSVGVGAHFDADASVSMDQVRIGVDTGAALGIGGGVKFSVDFSPAKAAEEIKKWNPF